MPNVGFPELVGILVIALIVFGPKKLPEIGKTLGKTVREFKKISREFSSAIDLNLDDEPVKKDPIHEKTEKREES